MTKTAVAAPEPEEPDFNQLSQAEQRLAAERLMRIQESGWKPFWCPDPDCDGMPHWQLFEESDGSFSHMFADQNDLVGPLGQPLGEMLYQTPDGEYFETTGPFGEAPLSGDTPVGRPILDPNWAHNHARSDQRLLPWSDPWTLFIMSGRGSGKTRTGIEFVTLSARRGLDGAILGRRGTELVNTHVAEIIAHAHPEFMPVHWASKDILEWPNGAITYLFSAEKPENIRSVNLSYAWVDEAAFMDEIKTAWMNLKMATRVHSPGNPIHFLITSTPTGTPWVIEMEDNPDVTVRRVSTYANRANLDPGFLRDLEKEYEGTRMGRQELHGEVLRDVEGALWNDDLFKHERAKSGADFARWVESMDDRVIAVDPAGSANKRSDLTGIIGVGSQHTDENGDTLAASSFTVLCDATIKGTPSEWAEQVFKAARLIRANRIVAEKNFGGEMVEQVLRDWAKLHPVESRDENGDEFRITVVHAVQSKETRAESAVGKYEQGRVTHLLSGTAFGDLSALEKEQVLWVPKSRGGRLPSPNRIDALVWAVRELETKIRFTGQVATARDVMSKMRIPGVSPARSTAPVAPPRVSGSTPRKTVKVRATAWEGQPRRRFPVKRRD